MFQRLDGHVPGQRQLGLGPAAVQATERLEREGLKVREWEPKLRYRTGKQRVSEQRVEAGPNAPQLIRLVRTPFRLEPAWIRREPYAEIGMPQRSERADLDQALRECREERAAYSRPGVRDRPLPKTEERRLWRSGVR